MLCPCRQRLRNKENNDPKRALAIKGNVDYTQLYPNVNSIMARPFPSDRDALLELQNVLQIWANCHSTMCIPPDHARISEVWEGAYGIPHSQWDDSLRAQARDVLFKVERAPWQVSCRNIINTLTERNNWKYSEAPLWNFHWRWHYDLRSDRSLVWQVRNTNGRSNLLAPKTVLKKNVQSCWSCTGKDENLFHLAPLTFHLPKERAEFVDAFHSRAANSKSNVWVLKPALGTQGKGIELVDKVEQAAHADKHVVQVYIDRPLLVKGYKFDFRLYVAVTSWNPLEAYLCRNGAARFCKTKYTSDLSNKYAHLTNVSKQKFSKELGPLGGPSASTFPVLRKMLEEQGVQWEPMWNNVKDCVLQTLCCVEPQHPQRTNMFEYMGVDILVDEDLRPWLLEANSLPSLEGHVDLELTRSVIQGIGNLAHPMAFDRNALGHIVERRLNEAGPLSPADEKEQWNEDLHRILGGQVPRKYGEQPRDMGEFDVLAPSPAYDKYRQHYPLLNKVPIIPLN